MNENSPHEVLKNLSVKRSEWIKAEQANNFNTRKILTDLYPDRAHFVYELLQNAEDAEAQKVHFELERDKLSVAHNGNLFTPTNVDSITSIATSAKRDDINKIGKFGIGFKAVFAYTDKPRIHSGDFHFEIRDLVCPVPVAPKEIKNGQTKFEFPFNRLEKSSEDCFNEVTNELVSLADNTLLFLNNIEEVSWSINNKQQGSITRLDHDENVVEIEHSVSDGEKAASSFYLKYQKEVDITKNQETGKSTAAIAFKLDFKDKEQQYFNYKKNLGEQMRIVQTDGQLSIFFPASKETTKLKFHIHAPFASTVARDSVPHERPENKKLLENIAELTVDSIVNIKELGLLTVEFLEVLPNQRDELEDFYQPIRNSIVQAMQNQPLVPTYGQTYAPASHLLQGPAAIKNVITDRELHFFTDRNEAKWVIGVSQKHSRPDQFLADLGIGEWSWKELKEFLDNSDEYTYRSYYNSSRAALQWLAGQPDEWIQKFYALLDDLLTERGIHATPTTWHIIRISTGEHKQGEGVYFPEAMVDFDVGHLSTVKPEILEGKNKPRINKVRHFLEEAGVQEIGEREKIQAILEAHYTKDSKPITPAKLHLQHMRMFVAWYMEAQDKSVFEENIYHLFLSKDEKQFLAPKDCYLDLPFEKTELSLLFEGELKEERSKHPLWAKYREIPFFTEFAKAVGVMFDFKVVNCETRNNPDRRNLQQKFPYTKKTWTKTDIDFTILGLREYLRKQNYGVSKLIWRQMCKANTEVLKARYSPNETWTNRLGVAIVPSQLVHSLKSESWIPDKAGNFYRPSEITQDLLPDDFPYDNRNGWLTAIEFGKKAEKESQTQRENRKKAQELGVSSEVVEELSAYTENEQKEFLEFWKQVKKRKHQSSPEVQEDEAQADSGEIFVSFSEAFRQEFSRPGKGSDEREYGDVTSMGDVNRRRARTESDIREGVAAEPAPIERFRQVPRKIWESKKNQSRVSVREAYHGECQICGDTFVKRDGERYFEGVYIISVTKARWIDRLGNVLCLCPKHSAMFEHGSVEADDIEAQVNAFELDGNEVLLLRVVLCGEEVKINFSRNHMLDLQEMLKLGSSFDQDTDVTARG
jgi:antitoxin component of MazEF toxin-antitoxin module